MFVRFCSMMRRTDLLLDPRFATAPLRRQNLGALLSEVRAWILTFTDLDELQAQVSEAGLAVGVVRSTSDLAESEWAQDWGAIVQVDDRSGGTMRMPGVPWRFSSATLPPPGIPAFQGEHNIELLAERNVNPALIDELRQRRVLLSRRSLRGEFDEP
jgi:crotonobetainyl-CoA:carnitine CoA-transferase CaiB-like acyl-CoA transferase